MSLTLRQVPVRCPAPGRGDWQSPTTIPRSWMTAAFAVSAAFALAMTLITTDQLHRVWGIFASCTYLAAAMAVLLWESRGRDLALLISLGGALVAPLLVMAADWLHEPEVWVIKQSAITLVHHGTPYLAPSVLAAARSPNIFDPYLPLMSAFGLPRTLLGLSLLTDPRIWFGIAFVAAFAAALALAGVRDVARWTVLVTASPLIAFSLVVGGTDLPVLACQCLGLALLWRRDRLVLAGLALGAAAAMKATAWPALAVTAILVGCRDGKRALARLAAAALAVVAVVIGPVAALGPRALVQNTIAFPLGLASVKSDAVSPLPGRLLAETGAAGRILAVVLLAAAGLALVASLVLRPPRTVPSATWRLVVGLSLMFVLAPATRFGYFVYPAGLLVWLVISWLSWGGVERSPPAAAGASPSAAVVSPPVAAGAAAGAPSPVGASSAYAEAQAEYHPANQGSSAASGMISRTVWE
jgi:glycosyl transferase family 87